MRLPQNPPSPVSARAEIQPGIWLDSRLALWLPDERLLVVADLHWGYAASHRSRGNLLPLWGDDEIEARLRALIADYTPAALLWLGDIVHAAEGSARAERWLRESPVPTTLLAGNHDRRWRTASTRSLERGRFFFHHGDQPLSASMIEVVGHHHPAVGCGDQAGTRVKLPALVASANRLILPAFSPWAAGTPWNDRLTPMDTLWVIAPSRIFALPRSLRSCATHAA
ncbi:MAG: metallophosphoesterase [Verrucomicrobiota bacterium]